MTDQENGQQLRAVAPTTCPRCGGSLADAEFYGLCDRCCRALRETFTGEKRDVVADAYEPKVNVTPNAVASKDE